MKLRNLGAVALLVCVTVLAYANSLSNHFVWDDQLLVVENPHVRNSTYLPLAFTSDLFHTDSTSGGYYRPVQTASYMLDYYLYGLRPTGYHFTNLLLHLVCVLLVWRVVFHFLKNTPLSVAAAALFAVHPLNTNAVTYIAGRADMLACAGMLASLISYIHYRNQPAASPNARALLFGASAVFYLLALFSRENSLIFPLLICLYVATTDAKRSRALLAALPFALLGIAYIFFRYEVLTVSGKSFAPEASLSLFSRLHIPFRAVATYAGLFLWPAHLQMERQVVAGGMWLTVLTLAGLFIVAAACWAIGRAKTRSPALFFGLSWAALTLLPILGLLRLPATVAEHWLYFPSIGLYLAGAALVTNRRTAGIVWMIALVCLTARTIARNRDWHDEMSLYSSTKRAAPQSPGVRNNLSREYAHAGKYGAALQEMLAAERARPRDPFTKSNLAAIYEWSGDDAAALAKNRECLALDPLYVPALIRAAQISERHGDIHRASRYFHEAASASTAAAPAISYGVFLLQHRQLTAATEMVNRASVLEPGNAEAFNLLGAILVQRLEFDRAEAAFHLAADLDRQSPRAFLNLARMARARGDFAAATAHYRHALALQPGNPTAREGLEALEKVGADRVSSAG